MYVLQSLVLVVGTIFAWSMVRLEILADTNIWAGTCVYGAIVFSIAFLVSLYVLMRRAERKWQLYLSWLIGAGAIFGWSNFGYKVWGYYAGLPCETCPPIALPGFYIFPPLGSPCFWGAVIFTIALIVAVIINKRSAK